MIHEKGKERYGIKMRFLYFKRLSQEIKTFGRRRT